MGCISYQQNLLLNYLFIWNIYYTLFIKIFILINFNGFLRSCFMVYKLLFLNHFLIDSNIQVFGFFLNPYSIFYKGSFAPQKADFFPWVYILLVAFQQDFFSWKHKLLFFKLFICLSVSSHFWFKIAITPKQGQIIKFPINPQI